MACKHPTMFQPSLLLFLSGPGTDDFHAVSHLRDTAAVFNNSVAVAPVRWRALISDR